MNSIWYLGDRLNVSGGSEAAVTAKTRTGGIKLRECLSWFMEESLR